MTNVEIGATIGAMGGMSAGTVAGAKHGVLLAAAGFLGGGVAGYIVGIFATIAVLVIGAGIVAAWRRVTGRGSWRRGGA